jgi:pyridoxal 5'-phosphate synthase pdxS subunit
MRAVMSGIRRLTQLAPEERMTEAKTLGAPYELVCWVAEQGKLPVPNFAAGGIATPADAALMMQLGAEAVFVGSGIFKSGDPRKMAGAIVRATTHFRDAAAVAEVSRGLGAAMPGIETATLDEKDLLQTRGW